MTKLLTIVAFTALTMGCSTTRYIVVPVETVRTVYVSETPPAPIAQPAPRPVVVAAAPVEPPPARPMTAEERREQMEALEATIEAARCYGREEGEGPCRHRAPSSLDNLIDAARRYDQPN